VELELRDFISIIWRRIWLLVTMITLSLGVSGIFSYFILQPEYETFATLLVGKPDNYQGETAYSNLVLNEKLVRTYGEIAKSKSVISTVINNLKLSTTYESLQQKINIAIVTDTEIIRIEVVDKDPVQAVIIANEFSNVLIERIQELMKIDNIQIIDQADIPNKPVKPRPVLNMAIAVSLASLAGLIIVFLLEYLYNKIKTSADIEKYLGLQVIGTVPKEQVVENPGRYNLKEIILSNNPKSIVLESFRTIRTNLQFKNSSKSIKSILVTSSKSSEGKSYVVANLAFTIALTNKRILLIDTDLRQPTIQKHYQLLNYYGVTNILNEELDYRELVVSTGIGKLDILPTGPIPLNPSEILASIKMKKFLEDVQQDYDIILLDSPPVGLVTDASIIASMVDSVILVCASDETKIEDAKKSHKLLKNVNANILGVVLNKVKAYPKDYYNYQSYNSSTDNKHEDHMEAANYFKEQEGNDD